MTMIGRLREDLLTARKARDAVPAALLTALVGEAAMVGKNASNRESTDDEVTATIRKFLKNAEETAQRQADANKDATVTLQEIQILRAYLPQQMAEAELRAAITEIIQAGATNMGAVMKGLKDAHGGRYDGKMANQLVKELLA